MTGDDVTETLAALNRAWREQRFQELSEFFDEGVVMKGPALKEVARGRNALVQSYIDFMSRSKVLEYQESNHSTYVWGTIACASYDWLMAWEQSGATHRESGQDMFVFQRRGSRWVAVMRLMLV